MSSKKFEFEIHRAVAYAFGVPDPFKQYEPEDNRIQSQFYWLEHGGNKA